MQDRYIHILEAAVREFIETGEPVSSAQLFRNYDFGIKPAMIRAELARLTEDGYLEQWYHSAGRVPSDRGYEFFAARVLESPSPMPLEEDLRDPLREGDMEQFLSELAQELGLVAALGTRRGKVMKEGLEPLMEHLSWGSRESMMQVIRDFEAIEERVARMKAELFNKDFLEVFIGRKSPVTKSEELAVVAGDCMVGDDQVVLLAIGPKRMDYEKVAAVFKGLKNQKKQNQKHGRGE